MLCRLLTLLPLSYTNLTVQKPFTVSTWVAVRPLAVGKRENPKWGNMRDESALVGVGIE